MQHLENAEDEYESRFELNQRIKMEVETIEMEYQQLLKEKEELEEEMFQEPDTPLLMQQDSDFQSFIPGEDVSCLEREEEEDDENMELPMD